LENSVKTNKFTPAITSSYLLIIAGMVWLAVGIMLCNFAYHWMLHYDGKYTILIVIAGIVLAVIFALLKFKRFADKNIDRIRIKPELSCAFSFMSWQTYIIVAFMITGGILLRHSSLPKEYLSILYIGIGGALALSSLRYFSNFFASDKK